MADITDRFESRRKQQQQADEGTSTIPAPDTKTILDYQARERAARATAVLKAREALGSRSGGIAAPNASPPSTDDLLRVAEWIYNGVDQAQVLTEVDRYAQQLVGLNDTHHIGDRLLKIVGGQVRGLGYDGF